VRKGRTPGALRGRFVAVSDDKRGNGMEDPVGTHPEKVDPPWLRELVRRALERQTRANVALGLDIEESFERALWVVLDLRTNLADLYGAGRAFTAEELDE
jgi:hypothetical protein